MDSFTLATIISTGFIIIFTPFILRGINSFLKQVPISEQQRVATQKYPDYVYYVYIFISLLIIAAGCLGLVVGFMLGVPFYQEIFYGSILADWRWGELIFAFLSSAFLFIFLMLFMLYLVNKFTPKIILDYSKYRAIKLIGWTAEEKSMLIILNKICLILFIAIIIDLVISAFYFKIL